MSASDLYSPLPGDSFRVLKILTADENEFICELQRFTFDEAPEYIALSYAWGIPERSASITCNRRPFLVTPHLHGALRQLHLLDPNGMFWIDAICINQQDDDEKAIHTRNMNIVYRSSKLVFVWLGKAENRSDMAVDMIKALNKKFAPILQNGTSENIAYIKGWMENDELTSSGLPATSDPIWRSLGLVYSQTWFTRLWTLQEVVLAEQVIVAHGTKHIDWASFVALSNTFSRAALISLMTETPEKERKLRKSLTDLHFGVIARRSREVDQFIKIPNLLRICRHRDVTEKVDKIYGLLGMLNPQIASQIVVDYSTETRRDWWKVYIQYGKLQLQSEGMLTLLSMASSKHRPAELPSWCPNFNSPPGDDFNFAGVIGYQAGFDSWEERIQSRVLSVPDSDNLKFFGFQIDRVHTVVSSPEYCYVAKEWKGPGGTVDQLLQYEVKCLELSQQTYDLHDQIPDAHWRTLVADSTLQAKTPLEPEVKEDYLRLKEQWAWQSDTTHMDYVGTVTPSERQSVLSYYQSIEAKKTRTFFSTDGRRVGLGPFDLRVGDIICVLYGGAPLFVLRFEDGEEAKGDGDVATLIGDAYVHGLMDLKSMPSNTRREDRYFLVR